VQLEPVILVLPLQALPDLEVQHRALSADLQVWALASVLVLVLLALVPSVPPHLALPVLEVQALSVDLLDWEQESADHRLVALVLPQQDPQDWAPVLAVLLVWAQVLEPVLPEPVPLVLPHQEPLVWAQALVDPQDWAQALVVPLDWVQESAHPELVLLEQPLRVLLDSALDWAHLALSQVLPVALLMFLSASTQLSMSGVPSRSSLTTSTRTPLRSTLLATASPAPHPLQPSPTSRRTSKSSLLSSARPRLISLLSVASRVTARLNLPA
jgi:hypothetical protein